MNERSVSLNISVAALAVTMIFVSDHLVLRNDFFIDDAASHAETLFNHGFVFIFSEDVSSLFSRDVLLSRSLLSRSHLFVGCGRDLANLFLKLLDVLQFVVFFSTLTILKLKFIFFVVIFLRETFDIRVRILISLLFIIICFILCC